MTVLDNVLYFSGRVALFGHIELLWYKSITKAFWGSEICFYYMPSYASGYEAAIDSGPKSIRERNKLSAKCWKILAWANAINEQTRLRQQQGSNPGNRIILFAMVKVTLDALRPWRQKLHVLFLGNSGNTWILIPFVNGNSQVFIECDELHFESRKILITNLLSKFLLSYFSQPAPSLMFTYMCSSVSEHDLSIYLSI